MKKIYIPIICIVITFSVTYFVFQTRVSEELRVSFLDVGQGDAIFIQSPSGVQVLIDGGKDTKVIERLHSVMPLFDRSIDILIATHPDLDHIGGLTDVIKRFDVGLFLESGNKTENDVQEILYKEMNSRNIERKIIKRGEEYDLGSGAYLEILYPYTDVSNIESNASSIIARLTYGEHSFLLTGDAPIESELMLLGTDKEKLTATVLKFGHHGSNTSTHSSFLAAVRPVYGVVSAGKGNTYGHPHKDVINYAKGFKVTVLETAKMGTITFSTDGKEIEVLGLSEDLQEGKSE